MTGTSYHVLRNTKYQGGGWTIDGPEVNGWLPIRNGRNYYFARPVDLFETEEAAKAEAKARRKPRTQRTPVALYGDHAWLAMISGISTDGTGRSAR